MIEYRQKENIALLRYSSSLKTGSSWIFLQEHYIIKQFNFAQQQHGELYWNTGLQP